VRLAVTTPAAVELEVTSPVAPDPAAPEVRTSYWYPLAGAGEAAVHPIVAAVVVIAEALTADGTLQEAGVHVKVCPEAGDTVDEIVTVAELEDPAVVEDQLVVEERLL
jgi:hypothetical protein